MKLVPLPVRRKGAHYVNPAYVRSVLASRLKHTDAACCRVVFGSGVSLLVDLPADQVVAMLEGRAGGKEPA